MGKRVFRKTEPAPRALDFLDKKPSPINTRPIHNDKIAARMRQFNVLLEKLEAGLAKEVGERLTGGVCRASTLNETVEARQELRRFVRMLK